MIRKLSAFVVLFCLWSGLYAQMPGNYSVEGQQTERRISSLRMACTNEAGSIDLLDTLGGSFILDSIIYLPFGESFNVVHDGNFDFGGDPNPTTTPGIVYLYYTCRPSVGKGSISELAQDPCRFTAETFVNNGSVISRMDSFWISRGDLNGDLEFVNDSTIQRGFNNGAPFQLWFAPATIDNFASSSYEADPNTGEGGPCVDVSPQEAFSVVYLNEISVQNISNMEDGQGCTGAFDIQGGLPEFDSAERYSISIVNAADNSIEGEVTNQAAVGNNGTARFFVPEPGTYNVTITDAAGSSRSFQVDMSGCNAISFSLPFRNARPGDIVCMPLRVTNFDEVAIMQFDINWDPAVLSLTAVQNFNNDLTGFSSDNFSTSSGEIKFSWPTSFVPNVSLPDGSILLELCFEVIGNFGSNSPVTFEGNNFESFSDENLNPLGYIFNNGQINTSNEVLFVDVDASNITCNSNNVGPTDDGRIKITVAQGQPPYDIFYKLTTDTGPGNTTTLTNEGEMLVLEDLPAGTYQIDIVDNAGTPNTFSNVYQITEPDQFDVRVEAVQDLSCSDSDDGIVEAQVLINASQVSNPESQFDFEWNVQGETNALLDSIPRGPYSVTVTDGNGCSAEGSTVLSAPQAIVVPDDSIFIDNPSCSGILDGQLEIRPSGGCIDTTGAYQFDWEDFPSNTGSNSVQTGIESGIYQVTITDDNNCSTVDSFLVLPDKELVINSNVTDVSCSGGTDGEILTSATIVSNGPGAMEALPYTFTWANTNGDTPDNTNTTSAIENLVADTYVLTMEDADGCTVTDSIQVQEPDPINITVVDRQDDNCTPENDGFVEVGVTGGTDPYVYNWDTGAETARIDSLAEGTYRLTVTDDNGCSDSTFVDIDAPQGPIIVLLENDTLDCNGDADGNLSVDARNGNGNITTYTWTTPDGTTVNGEILTGLAPGAYEIAIASDAGCLTVDTAFVIEPSPLQVDSIGVTAPTCPGERNGLLSVFASGGTGPYTYRWSDDPNQVLTQPSKPGISAGTYTVTVTDANNCQPPATQTVTVEDPADIIVNIIDESTVNCFDGDCDGQATVTARYADGRQSAFSFTFANGEESIGVDTAFATMLCAGETLVTAVDSNNCQSTDTVNIGSPPEILPNLSANAVSCNGLSDGAARVDVSGGTAPYSIEWLNSGTQADSIADLTAGNYPVLITDSNNCTKRDTASITEPDELRLIVLENSDNTRDPSCSNTQDGQITVQPNTNANINPLGAAPYTWSDGVGAPDSAVATGLSAGTYSVSITDTRGCTDSVSYTLDQPTPVQAIVNQPEDPLCFGDATFLEIDTAFGGSGSGYSYELNNNGLTFEINDAAPIFAGLTRITVFDGNGCTYEDSVRVQQPDQLLVEFNPSVITVELGDSLTQLQPEITSSTPIGSYSWTPDVFLSNPTVENPFIEVPLNSQEYTLTVQDINGCSASGRIFVELDRNRNVYVPNAFSPDNDGQNDEFKVFACNGVKQINFAQIYDRWGNLIYSEDTLPLDCNNGTVIWNGETNNGVDDLGSGVYVYVVEIEFLDDVKLVYRGSVAIVR